MKLKSILSIFVLVGGLLVAPAAQAEGHTFGLRVDPLGFLFGTINIGADYAVAPNWTIGGDLAYSSLSSGDTELTAFGAGVRAQYFAKGVFTESFYFAPYASYSSGTGNSVLVDDATVSVLSFGAIIGYMWIWDNFNIQLGGGIRHITIDSDNDAADFDAISGVLPAIEFNLGWAF